FSARKSSTSRLNANGVHASSTVERKAAATSTLQKPQAFTKTSAAVASPSTENPPAASPTCLPVRVTRPFHSSKNVTSPGKLRPSRVEAQGGALGAGERDHSKAPALSVRARALVP